MANRTVLASLLLIAFSGCSHDIKLRVIDAESGQPLPKATVHRWPRPYDLVLSPLLDGWSPRQTGADGRMNVPVRGDGTKYRFAVDAWDYQSVDGFVRIEQPDTLVIDWATYGQLVSTSRPNADGILDVRLPKKRKRDITDSP